MPTCLTAKWLLNSQNVDLNSFKLYKMTHLVYNNYNLMTDRDSPPLPADFFHNKSIISTRALDLDKSTLICATPRIMWNNNYSTC